MRINELVYRMKGELFMTMATFSTGFLYTVIIMALWIMDRDMNKAQEEFMNFE